MGSRVNLVKVTFHPPRCWICGHRIHHALTGAVLLLAPNEAIRLAGILLILSDLHDRHVWLSDLKAVRA